MKKRSEKQQDVDNLKSDLAKVSTVILTTFQGITVAEDTQLRRAVQSCRRQLPGGEEHAGRTRRRGNAGRAHC